MSMKACNKQFPLNVKSLRILHLQKKGGASKRFSELFVWGAKMKKKHIIITKIDFRVAT